MAELMFPDIAGSFMRGQQFGTQQRQEREAEQRRSGLASLAQQAYTADPSQREGLIGQAIGIDPAAGMALGEGLQGNDDRRTKSMVNMAKMLTTAPEQYRAGLYQQMMPALQQMGLSQLPPQYDETVAQAAQAIVQAYAPQGEGTPSSIRELQMLQANPELAALDMKRRTAGFDRPQLIQTQDGYAWATPQGAAPLNYGGGAQSAPTPQGVPAGAGLTQFTGSDGQPVNIGDDIPSHLRAQILGQTGAFDAAPDGATATLPPASVAQFGGGQRVMPAPKAAAASFAPLSSEEVRQLGLPEGTVAQRNTSTGEVKIVNRPPQQANSNGGVNSQKLAQANATKMAQFSTAERAIERIEQAAGDIAGNSFFDGGPIDQMVLGKMPQGQELQQASASLLPVLTALTRVPGVGAQSDLESRLATLQMPSAEFPPEVNRRAAKALREYMRDLRSAYENVQAPAAPPQPQGQGGWSIQRVGN